MMSSARPLADAIRNAVILSCIIPEWQDGFLTCIPPFGSTSPYANARGRIRKWLRETN